MSNWARHVTSWSSRYTCVMVTASNPDFMATESHNSSSHQQARLKCELAGTERNSSVRKHAHGYGPEIVLVLRIWSQRIWQMRYSTLQKRWRAIETNCNIPSTLELCACAAGPRKHGCCKSKTSLRRRLSPPSRWPPPTTACTSLCICIEIQMPTVHVACPSGSPSASSSSSRSSSTMLAAMA